MSFENIRAVKRLLSSGARAWAEAAHHGSFVVGQGVAVLVVFSCETFDMVIASLNRAFFGSFILMSQHVSLQILKYPSAVRVCAAALDL